MLFHHRFLRRGCLALLLAGGCAISIHAYSIKSPSSGDTVYFGEDIKIKWESEKNKNGNVAIDLFLGEKQVVSLGEMPDKGKMKWTVASGLTPSNTYRIKISNSTQKDAFSLSDPFTIQKPSLKILAPDSQTTWQIGYNSISGAIRWEKKGVRGPIKIELIKHSRLVHTLSSGAMFSSSYSTNFADGVNWLPSSEYRIKLISNNNPDVFCFSDEFTIKNSNAPYSLKGVDLSWMPTRSDISDIDLKRVKNRVFKMGIFTDERKDTTFVGMNKEYKNTRLVTTDESVSQWCGHYLEKVLQNNQVKFDTLNYDIVLSGAVRDFNIMETTTYKATIAINFQALSKSGERIWEQQITGTASNWGTSYKLENYYECISNALIETARNLLTNDDFQNALNQAKHAVTEGP
jgi:hypothetical protein